MSAGESHTQSDQGLSMATAARTIQAKTPRLRRKSVRDNKQLKGLDVHTLLKRKVNFYKEP